MEEIHSNQLSEVLPYLFEPEPTDILRNDTVNSDSESQSSSDDEEVDESFELENGWRLQTLSWCKCGQCTLSTRAIECFCCHEKALEYDEYDGLLAEVEGEGDVCITAHSDFKNNMLSESVLKIDICRYLDENWPIGDEDMAKTHKLYRLVAYQRCSRWIFQILGKKVRRPFPSCIYSKIREAFASPDGLYTHFKYAKKNRYFFYEFNALK